MAPRQTLGIRRLQTADQILGRTACVALQPLRWKRRLLAAGRARAPRVLLIKFWGLGSLQLLTPAVRALRRRRPDAELDLLTLRENADFARALGVFDEVHSIDIATGSWTRLFLRLAGLVRGLRRERYDEVVDFEFFTRFSAVVTALSGARRTRGFHSPAIWRGGFHSHTVPFNRYWHVARNFASLAEGRDADEVQVEDLARARWTSADAAELDATLAEHGVAAGIGYVVLNANAGRLSLERRWPAERFAELARRLICEDGLRVVLIGAPAEREHVAGVVAAAGPLPRGFLLDLCGRLSIGALAKLLADAAAMVSNDSGPMHVAAALGTPTIGLFGPETPLMYGPLGPRARALWDPPSCSPCINVHDNKRSACVRGAADCMTNLSVDHVLEQTRASLWDGVLRPVAFSAAGRG